MTQRKHWQGHEPLGRYGELVLPAGTGRPGLFVPVRFTAAGKHSLMAEVTGSGAGLA